MTLNQSTVVLVLHRSMWCQSSSQSQGQDQGVYVSSLIKAILLALLFVQFLLEEL